MDPKPMMGSFVGLCFGSIVLLFPCFIEIKAIVSEIMIKVRSLLVYAKLVRVIVFILRCPYWLWRPKADCKPLLTTKLWWLHKDFTNLECFVFITLRKGKLQFSWNHLLFWDSSLDRCCALNPKIHHWSNLCHSYCMTFEIGFLIYHM